jgi:hypothetical protein
MNKTSWLSVPEACGACRKHRNLGSDKVSEILINWLSCWIKEKLRQYGVRLIMFNEHVTVQ